MKYPGQIRIIGGRYKGRKIPVLSMEALRPTPDRVRETLFNWLQGKLVGSRCIDFFAGTGILGFEALSRGANEVIMVDKAIKIREILEKTCQNLKIPQTHCKIVCQDAKEWIKTYQGEPFDLIFLDPPFQTQLLEECLDSLSKSALLGEQSKIYIERPTEKPMPELEGFEVTKSKKAGKVAYCLLEKI